uniref:DUF1206 domain-containing protein n=1 Tax=Macrostomum lignano TaxID=282301 RepID=A0A1I8I957_9PLAT
NVDPAQVRNSFETGSELEAPSGGDPDTLEEASEDARGDSRTRLDAAQADYTDRCLSSAIANLPGGSVLALGLLCGGIILLVTGFFLTRQELGTYVRQHQQPKSDVTFDEMFPSLLYWIAGLAAGLLAYGLLHCIVNVLVTVRVNRCARSSRKSPSITLTDSLIIAATGLMACAAFLPLYAQAMFAAKLAHGESEFDLQHYLPTWMNSGAGRVLESPESTGSSAAASSFPMFYPSLALFIGVCLIEISLMMLLIFLVSSYAQLASSIRTRRVQSSSKLSKNGGRGALDTQL